jgi:Predicted metal-sulfur cluster biosynthetic enzyme
MEERVTESEAWKALREVQDPELGYSVVELGMVYGIRIEGDKVEVDYSLTSFGCPLAESLEADMYSALKKLDPAAVVLPRLVWSPPWGPERMSEAVRLDLGYAI